MTSTSQFELEALVQLPALRRFAETLCRNRQRSDDLVQDTMLKAIRYFDTYKQGTNCRAWLFQICKHSFINDCRRRQYEPFAVDFQEEGRGGGDDAWGERSVHPDLREIKETQLEFEMIGDEVSNALRYLPSHYQTVLLLNDVEEYTYEEIASFMQVSVGTIRSRIHRARKMLAGQLEVYARSLGYETN